MQADNPVIQLYDTKDAKDAFQANNSFFNIFMQSLNNRQAGYSEHHLLFSIQIVQVMT